MLAVKQESKSALANSNKLNKELSGAHWSKRFSGSNNTRDL